MNYIYDIHKVVKYIESNLDKDICLDDIIKIANLSKYHFLRLFKALTGSTPIEYIRKRRLTHAAHQLIETQRPIIDIAFYYRYESQEAFTRVFRMMYGMTPKAYRMNKTHFLNINKIVLDENVLHIKASYDRLQPTIVNERGLTLIGMSYHGDNQNGEIPKLWNEFIARISEIKNIVDENVSYGYEKYTDKSKDTGQFTYVAAIEVEDSSLIPLKMVSIHIPPTQYAVFTIPAIVEDAQKMVINIYSKCLPRLGLVPNGNYDFELFDRAFVPNHYESKYHLYIPIKNI